MEQRSICPECGAPNCYCACDDIDDEQDATEFEETCHQFISNGIIYCGAVGSEDCDWCPRNSEIGKSA